MNAIERNAFWPELAGSGRVPATASEGCRRAKSALGRTHWRSTVATDTRYAPGSNLVSVLRQLVSQATDSASFSFATAIVAMSGSATPFFTAVTSARMDTAISGGVRLPM